MSNESNRETPNVVLSCGFDKQSETITLHVHPKAVGQFEGAAFHAKLGEYAGLVHGNIPNGTTNGLLDATKLYKGVKRPCLETNFDADIYTFITNPGFTYTYSGIKRYSGKPPDRDKKPINSVFVTYVKPYASNEIAERESPLAAHYVLKGVILDWEWVLADESAPSLPADAGNRYDTIIW